MASGGEIANRLTAAAQKAWNTPALPPAHATNSIATAAAAMIVVARGWSLASTRAIGFRSSFPLALRPPPANSIGACT